MERIVVVGAGVVGLATGQGFKRQGHDVQLIDINLERVSQLVDMGHNAKVELDLNGPPAFVFLALPTPAVDGSGYDLSSFSKGVKAVGTALKESDSHHTIIVRSTVPPRTLDCLVVPILEETSGRLVERDFSVASAPEFLREKTALEDFLNPRMTIIASRDAVALDRLARLFKPFGGSLRAFDNPVVAESIKIVHNVFNAAKISYWNEIWQLCQVLEIDAYDVATTVAISAEASYNQNYGIRGGEPYGGACLPKDVEGLLGFARNVGIDLPLIRSVKRVNDAIAEHMSIPVVVH